MLSLFGVQKLAGKYRLRGKKSPTQQIALPVSSVGDITENLEGRMRGKQLLADGDIWLPCTVQVGRAMLWEQHHCLSLAQEITVGSRLIASLWLICIYCHPRRSVTFPPWHHHQMEGFWDV